MTEKEAGAVTTRRPLGFPIALCIAAVVILVGLQILRQFGDAPFSPTQTLTPLVLLLLAAAIFVVGVRQRGSLIRDVAGPVIWARATRAELADFFNANGSAPDFIGRNIQL